MRGVYSGILRRFRKPVVSTWEPWDKEVAELVYYCRDYESFVKSVDKALAEDSEELRQKRLEVARKNSWDKRFLQMNGIINEMLHKKYCAPT